MAKYKSIIYLFLSLMVASCVFAKKIKTGEAAYERKQFAVAVEMLASEFEKQSNKRSRSRTAYLLGESYNYLEEPQLAIDWLKKAVLMEYGNEALLSLAKSYKKAGDYSASIEAYEMLKDKSNNKREIDREIYVLKDVSKWSSDVDNEVKISALGQNSGYSEYSPVVFDKNFLVFTSDRDESTGSDTYNWTGNKHTDLYVMLKNGSSAKRFDAAINSDANEGTACFTKDGNEMVFSRCYSKGDADGFCKLMYSERFTGIWSEPKELPFLIEGINYGQPTFIEGDSVLVYSANIESGSGGHDLYYVEHYVSEEGRVSWGEAYLFPATINSVGNEMFPVGDGDTLYFSSDYFAGLGGLDIFKTWLKPDGQWAPPQNLKKPINSSYDDFGYYVDNSAQLRGKVFQKGFFTSTRNGDGKEDLYKFERSKIESNEPVDTPFIEEVEIEIYLAGKTKEIDFSEPENPNSEKIGKKALPNSYVVITDGESEEKIYSDENGQFIVQLKAEKEYRIKASKIGYLNSFVNVSTKNLSVEKGNCLLQ